MGEINYGDQINSNYKKRSTLRVVLYTFGVLIVAAIVVIGSFAFWGYNAVQDFNNKDKAQVILVVDSFINLVDKSKFEQAYDLFSADTKSQVLFEKFKTEAASMKPLMNGYIKQNSSFNNIQLTRYPNMTEVSYVTKTEYSDGTSGSLNVSVAKVNSEWKINNIYLSINPEHLLKK